MRLDQDQGIPKGEGGGFDEAFCRAVLEAFQKAERVIGAWEAWGLLPPSAGLQTQTQPQPSPPPADWVEKVAPTVEGLARGQLRICKAYVGGAPLELADFIQEGWKAALEFRLEGRGRGLKAHVKRALTAYRHREEKFYRRTHLETDIFEDSGDLSALFY